MSNTESLTSLTSLVQIRQHSIRSVNVEQDLLETQITEGYLLTSQARRALARLTERIGGITPQRAWTLTGPYGSGKSYFGLFLMNLFGASLPAHRSALLRLQHIDPVLVDHISQIGRLTHTRGLLPIAITGYRTLLQECIRKELRRAAEQFSDDPAVYKLLQNHDLWNGASESRLIAHALSQLAKAITNPSIGHSGILLVLDEMGKPLEHASAHPDTADIYLLQEIAELANRSGDTPILFVGILHQAFERYVGHADTLTQREWAKVQGRFEDIAFQEPPIQQLWLLANALEYTDEKGKDGAWHNTEQIIEEAIQGNWVPPLMKEEEFHKLCRRTQPFHPTAMVALPYLFQRLAQNERSMFAYLTSFEPLGFQEFLASHAMPARVRLADLFDYVAANFQGRLYSSLRARSLTEALGRLESNPAFSPLEVEALKTIGLLNWLAEIGPFQASTAKVCFALRTNGRSEQEIRETLTTLQKQSAITFRRFSQTYAIWQGSDVDIEERVDEARRNQLATFSTAQTVQEYLPPQPIVARRHSYETGTTRFFEVRYADSLTYTQISLTPSAGASGLIVLCLSSSVGEAESLADWAQTSQFQERSDIVFGILARTLRLTELLKEIRGLYWVRDNTPELRDDPVARRELRTRLGELETLIRNELDQTLRLHRLADGTGCRWYHRGQDVSHFAQRGLTHLLSKVCDQLFVATPTLRNEILNRRQLSSQGAAARRNLIEAMLLRADQPDLGIEGFPPERSMYESLLKTSELHRVRTDGTLGLASPTEVDSLRLTKVWQAIHDYVFALPPQPRSIEGLFTLLGSAPYGITDGVLPVLLCAFLIVNRDETTLYNEGSLLPEPGIADWEVLLRRPELFAVAGCRIVGPRRVIVNRLAKGLQTEPAAMPVVRELIRRLKTLPEHAWRTQRLSNATLAARRAIEKARSPEQLLFEELPVIFGLTPPTVEEEIAPTYVEQFFVHLNATLQELGNATPRLLEEARDHLLSACDLPDGEDGWQQFLNLAGELAPKIHQPPLAPLLRRAREASDQRAALESTLAYVANRPPRTWTDGDSDRFRQQAESVGTLFQRERTGHCEEARLTSTQRNRSHHIAEKMRSYLQEMAMEEPLVIQAALQALLQEYRQPEPV